MRRWVTTRRVLRWDSRRGIYVPVEELGYWHDGRWALATAMAPDVNSYAWKWSKDFGSPPSWDTPTYLTSADSQSVEVPLADLGSAIYYLFVGAENVGNAAGDNTLLLQHDNAGDASPPTWEYVNATSSHVRNVDGAENDQAAKSPPVGTPSTTLMAAGTGNRTQGRYKETAGGSPDALRVHVATGPTFPDGEWSIGCVAVQFQAADFSGGETLKFRLLNESLEVIDLNAGEPQVTIEAAGGPFLPYHAHESAGNVKLRM